MTNFDRALAVLDAARRPGEIRSIHPYDAVEALANAGLLAPDVQIIRTVEDLKALDPDTALTLYTLKEATIWAASYFQKRFEDTGYIPDLPAVVIATGAQVRVAREAMEKEE